MNIIRVFVRRTAYTPTDSLAFVGDPPLMRPEADRIDVSCVFSWDLPAAERLVRAWSQYYPFVALGGPAVASYNGEAFTPGLYVKQGVTFTSRGCDNRCPWCLVPEREGPLRLLPLPITPGHIVQDNNFLSCPPWHRQRVYAMLAEQPRAAVFAGGLQASLVTDGVAEELRGIRVGSVFLAADTDAHLPALRRAVQRLSFLGRKKLRCYVLCGFGGETLQQAEARLEAVWEAGAMPFAQLYRPAEGRIEYSREWRALAKAWSRPAAMMAMHKEAT